MTLKQLRILCLGHNIAFSIDKFSYPGKYICTLRTYVGETHLGENFFLDYGLSEEGQQHILKRQYEIFKKRMQIEKLKEITKITKHML